MKYYKKYMITILCGRQGYGKTEFIKNSMIPTLPEYLVIDNAYEYSRSNINSICPFYSEGKKLSESESIIRLNKAISETTNNNKTTIIFELFDYHPTRLAYGFTEIESFYNYCKTILQSRSAIFTVHSAEILFRNMNTWLPDKVYLWVKDQKEKYGIVKMRTQKTEIEFKNYRDTFA